MEKNNNAYPAILFYAISTKINQQRKISQISDCLYVCAHKKLTIYIHGKADYLVYFIKLFFFYANKIKCLKTKSHEQHSMITTIILYIRYFLPKKCCTACLFTHSTNVFSTSRKIIIFQTI